MGPGSRYIGHIPVSVYMLFFFLIYFIEGRMAAVMCSRDRVLCPFKYIYYCLNKYLLYVYIIFIIIVLIIIYNMR